MFESFEFDSSLKRIRSIDDRLCKIPSPHARDRNSVQDEQLVSA